MVQAQVAISGTVVTSVKLNVRQASASIGAPVGRKLMPGTQVDVTALVVGDAVQGNAHWYAIAGGGFIWAGGCGPFQQSATAIATQPVPTAAATDQGSIAEAGLSGFGLDVDFATKLAALILQCRSQGLMFRISQGLRPPATQALYYCQWQERTPGDIDGRVTFLQEQGANWTAELVASYRDTARRPNWQTNALPGAGWHQWGEAADCYCYRDGVMVGNGSDPCYETYARIAESLGLTAGLRFSRPDPGHVQLRAAGGATDLYSWSFIDSVMKDRFGGKPSLL
jgi:hypothetical protein